MTPKEYISKQEPGRREIVSSIHNMLVDMNKRLTPKVHKTASQEMLVYNIGDAMIYGLASRKSHISLHMVPMYSSPAIYDKYKKLLSKAKFQKGCINFTKAEQMPLDVVKNLLSDCMKCEEQVMEYYKAKKK